MTPGCGEILFTFFGLFTRIILIRGFITELIWNYLIECSTKFKKFTISRSQVFKAMLCADSRILNTNRLNILNYAILTAIFSHCLMKVR